VRNPSCNAEDVNFASAVTYKQLPNQGDLFLCRLLKFLPYLNHIFRLPFLLISLDGTVDESSSALSESFKKEALLVNEFPGRNFVESSLIEDFCSLNKKDSSTEDSATQENNKNEEFTQLKRSSPSNSLKESSKENKLRSSPDKLKKEVYSSLSSDSLLHKKRYNFSFSKHGGSYENNKETGLREKTTKNHFDSHTAKLLLNDSKDHLNKSVHKMHKIAGESTPDGSLEGSKDIRRAHKDIGKCSFQLCVFKNLFQLFVFIYYVIMFLEYRSKGPTHNKVEHTFKCDGQARYASFRNSSDNEKLKMVRVRRNNHTLLNGRTSSKYLINDYSNRIYRHNEYSSIENSRHELLSRYKRSSRSPLNNGIERSQNKRGFVNRIDQYRSSSSSLGEMRENTNHEKRRLGYNETLDSSIHFYEDLSYKLSTDHHIHPRRLNRVEFNGENWPPNIFYKKSVRQRLEEFRESNSLKNYYEDYGGIEDYYGCTYPGEQEYGSYADAYCHASIWDSAWPHSRFRDERGYDEYISNVRSRTGPKFYY
jgi:hypothetical protein